jgi:hypothetical protein
MVELETISIVIAASSVAVGVVFALLELRNLARTRRADLVMKLSSTYGSAEMVKALLDISSLQFKDYDDFVNKYGKPSNKNLIYQSIIMASWHFESVGWLLHEGIIDANTIRQTSTAFYIWEIIAPIVKGLRKDLNQPETGKWFEYLYNEMKKKEQPQ